MKLLPLLLLLPLAAADPHDAMVPVRPNHAPGPEYADGTRLFQGIPGLERARNGRLWAVWYAGGPDEPTEGPGNYVVLVTSGDDGRTWSGPKLVLEPPGDVRAYDSTLWHDPQGRLWLYWAQSSHKWDGRSGVWEMHTDNSGEAAPKWSEPRRLADGIMMNKPTALKSGAWLFPSSVWAEKPGPGTRPEHRRDLGALVGANVFVSSDRGRTVTHLGQTRATDSIFDEHMVVERRDGSLWMLLRTRSGIAESTSSDGGRTWQTPAAPSAIPHVNSRFFIRRLRSGALLMVRHNPPDRKTRSHLTAYVSDDDGRTWTGGLALDERVAVSYPDGVEDARGNIRIIYDFERTKARQILMAVFTEKDVRRGQPSKKTRLRVLVNQASGRRSEGK
jgi:predicted neuraminidase